jgi:outer membrane protein OmpA-like peptidoglycan-associated protein
MIVTLIFLCVYSGFSQADEGYERDIRILKSNDTLVVHRKFGDFWFGAFSGVSLNSYFGDLIIKPSAEGLMNPFAQTTVYPPGSGSGLFIGVMGEWVPINENWGAWLKVRFYDSRFSSTQTQIATDSLNTYWKAETSLQYITISPGARYNTSISGLYLTAGLDFELNSSTDVKVGKAFENGSPIDELKIVQIDKAKARYGINLGVGYEFVIADINRKYRARISPYFSLHAGSNILTDYGSSWNAVMARAGLQIKIGKDRQTFDTLPFNPAYKEPPRYYASIKSDAGIQVDLSDFRSTLVSAWLTQVEVPAIQEEIREEPILDLADVRSERPEEQLEATKPVPVQKKIEVVPGDTVNFSFRTSASSELTTDAKAYLNAVAEVLKGDPNKIVRIRGHSDNRGTLPQNTQRSNARADEARKYLISRGVPAGRVFAAGVGSLYPIGDNNVESGRRKNRRIEVIVVSTR